MEILLCRAGRICSSCDIEILLSLLRFEAESSLAEAELAWGEGGRRERNGRKRKDLPGRARGQSL